MLIRGATILGSEYTDVRVSDGLIRELGTGLHRSPGEAVLDAHGGWLLPGLHDHHVHLRALAASMESISLESTEPNQLAAIGARLRRADAEIGAGEWIRGVNYAESGSVRLDRWAVDRMLARRPVRIQHRSGALWVLNSRACDQVGLWTCTLPGVERDAAGRVTGRLWRMDDWLRERIGAQHPDLAAVSARAAARGVTGFTDATPELAQSDVEDLALAVHSGQIMQRVHCMAPPEVTAPTADRFTIGPTKIILDDAALPSFDELVATVRATHARHRPVAVHCVTRLQLALTMAVLDTAGVRPGDRIEHGAIIPAESLEWLRRNEITVVTQPHFLVARAAQYRREVAATDLPDLWRLGSLRRAGVTVAASTDAPFGSVDPWLTIRAMVDRPAQFATGECLALPVAIGLFCGHGDSPGRLRTITPGAVADLIVLRTAHSEITEIPDDDSVATTIVGGTVVFQAI
ncbi:amidohydrolase family protein [Nocardia goodfellowii]